MIQNTTKIDPDLFLMDLLLLAFIAWLAGTFIYRASLPQNLGRNSKYENISTDGFTISEWIGSLVIVVFFSTRVWLPLLPGNESSLTSLESAPQSSELINNTLVILTLFIQFIIPCFILIFILSNKTNVLESFGLKHVQWGKVASYTLISFITSIFVLILLSNDGWYEKLTFQIFGKLPDQDAVQALKTASDPLRSALLISSAIIVAPICEEILFRGFLYTSTKKYTGPVFAIIVSSLLFSVIHGSASSFLPLFIVGILLAVSYELSGSLWTSILVHAAFNLFSVAAMQFSIG